MNDGLLDRLVDGELSPLEQRELLSQLDDEPNGWRRLALAFVEAQAWRREFAALSASTAQPSSRLVGTFGPSAKHTSRWLLTLAASLALAFGLGLVVRGPTPALAPDNGVVTAASQGAFPQPFDRELVRMVDGQTVDLPIFEAAQVSPDWVRSRPNLVPPPVRHELERSGHRVQQRRVFVPLILENGRPAVVPIDEAEVQFVGERVVQ
jgi:hypothetical protein